jgi:hypothetical protein
MPLQEMSQSSTRLHAQMNEVDGKNIENGATKAQLMPCRPPDRNCLAHQRGSTMRAFRFPLDRAGQLKATLDSDYERRSPAANNTCSCRRLYCDRTISLLSTVAETT